MTLMVEFLSFMKRHRTTPTLSVYVEGGLTDPATWRGWRVALDHAVSAARRVLHDASTAEKQRFDYCAAQLQHHLPSDAAIHRAGGWCLLCTADGDVFEATLPTRVTTSVTWQVGPVVMPFVATTIDDPVYVVQLDHDRARLLRAHGMSVEEIEEREAVMSHGDGHHMGDAPQLGFHPGTRGEPLHDTLQRRQRDARALLLHGVMQQVLHLMNGKGLLIIGGSAELSRQFHALLPSAQQRRAIVAPLLRMQTAPSTIMGEVYDALSHLLAARQTEWFTALQERATNDHHAALGPDDAARAVAHGAIEQLVFTDQYVRAHPDTAEQLAQDALLSGGHVAVAEPAAADLVNRDARGVAALLRFAIPPMEQTPPTAP